MNEQFTPRTLAIVALASLVTGFVVVFGSGMLAVQQPGTVAARGPLSVSPPGDGGTAAPTVPLTPPAHPQSPDNPVGTAVPLMAAGATDAGTALPTGVPDILDDGGTAGAMAGVTIAPGVVSRCFDQATPAVIPGPHCDALAALDQHFQAHAAQIAACAHGRGHLPFIMDFRFSTSFVRAWGGPSSTVPSAGVVAACVRRVTAPLPLAQIAHAHDRYIVVYGLDW